MKKQILTIASVLFISGALILTGCQKDDTTAPVVTLKGDASQTISLNSSYTDPGATAEDDEDGDISTNVTVSGTVNKDLAGTYTLTYSAADEAGNVGEATRTVIVKNDAENMEGTYNVVEKYASGSPDYSYTQVVTASKTVNNRITFNKFGDYTGNTNIYANVTGSTVDLPSQSAANIGTGSGTCDVASHTFSGTGSKTTSGFTINVTDQITSPASCAGTATYTQTYTK